MMEKKLIAPCGMNCGICKYHYREKKQCPGCRVEDVNKSKSCRECIIINCDVITKNHAEFCFECTKGPCKRLKNLDKRYRTKYHMSMLENLKCINEQGLDSFLEKESQKWTCPQCGGIVTCHGGMCLQCGFEKFKN
jgi:hypothetical protein